MRRELIFLVAGAALGAAASQIGSPLSVSEHEQAVTSSAPTIERQYQSYEKESSSSGLVESGYSVLVSANVANNVEKRKASASVAGKSANERERLIVTSPVPEPYDAMLKPRDLPKTLKTSELYERFIDDARDNAWADAMELGINQYIAKRGPELEVVFDFVECRSRYCVVAGVSYSQDRGPWNTFNPEMRDSGWWLASGGNSTVGGTYGSETRFATVISRERSDTVRPGSDDDPGKKPGESGTQSAEIGMAST